MSRSPLKNIVIPSVIGGAPSLSQSEFDAIVGGQAVGTGPAIDPNAPNIFGMDPNTYNFYRQGGGVPVGPDSPFYGRPGEGGGAAPISTMVNMGQVPFESQTPTTTTRTESTFERMPIRGLSMMPNESAFNLAQAKDITTEYVPRTVDYSQSSFANMSPAMQSGMIGGIAGIAQGLIGRAKRRREQRAASAEYRRMRAEYRNLDTSNLADNLQNPYAENVFEDLTVNQQAARFQEQQSSAARQNIMDTLRGAAGGSGIAGLAQSLANQATTAAQQASASIAQQEQRNQVLAAKGELQVQRGEDMVQRMKLSGAERSRALQRAQTETLFGMAQQRRAAADLAVAQGDAALMGGIGALAGTVLTGGVSNLSSGLTFFGGSASGGFNQVVVQE